MQFLARIGRSGGPGQRRIFTQLANVAYSSRGCYLNPEQRFLSSGTVEATTCSLALGRIHMTTTTHLPFLRGNRPTFSSLSKLLNSATTLGASRTQLRANDAQLDLQKSLRQSYSLDTGRGLSTSSTAEYRTNQSGGPGRGGDQSRRRGAERVPVGNEGWPASARQDGFVRGESFQGSGQRDSGSRDGRSGQRDNYQDQENGRFRGGRNQQPTYGRGSERDSWSRNGGNDRSTEFVEEMGGKRGPSSADSWDRSGSAWAQPDRDIVQRTPRYSYGGSGSFSGSSRGGQGSDRFGSRGSSRGGRGRSAGGRGSSRTSAPWEGRGSAKSKRENESSAPGGGRVYPWMPTGRGEGPSRSGAYENDDSRGQWRNSRAQPVLGRSSSVMNDEWEERGGQAGKEDSEGGGRVFDFRRREEGGALPGSGPQALQTSDWWDREGLGLPLTTPRPSKVKRGGLTKEERWKTKIARKREKRMLEQESKPSYDDFVARQENDAEWRARKKSWLVEEIVAMRPNPIVKLLNAQRSWISIQDVRDIIDELLKVNEGPRAVRTLKWCRQMEWYEPDFETYTKLAEEMARLSKISRCNDIYDMMITEGMVPRASTYEKIITVHIKDGQGPELETAWKMYERMKQFAELTPPPSLQMLLFKTFSEGPWGIRKMEQAEKVLRDMQAAGLQGVVPMYARLCELAGKRGDVAKVDAYLDEMRTAGVAPSKSAVEASVQACAHAFAAEGLEGRYTSKKWAEKREGEGADGEGEGGAQSLRALELVERAERGLREVREGWKAPDWSTYAAMMQSYVCAGQHEKVEGLLVEMKGLGVSPNLKVLNMVMEAHAGLGEVAKAEALLAKLMRSKYSPLQDAYNCLLKMYVGKGMVEKVEECVERMEGSEHAPNQWTYNYLIQAYLEKAAEQDMASVGGKALLRKAKVVYEKMKGKGGVGANQRTFEMLVTAFNAAGKKEEVKALYVDMHSLLGSRIKLADNVKEIAKNVVGSKRVLHDEKAKLKVRPEQREMLMGVLLGGAKIETHDEDLTYEVHFEQESEEGPKAALLKHLYQEMREWTVAPPEEKTVSGGDPAESGSEPRLLHFSTVSHPSFRFYAHQYYPEGKGVIPRLIHRWLSPRALAYWYMYGGSRCPSTGGILLNAKSYSAKEIKLVVKAMKGRTMDCERKKRKGGDVIRFTSKSATWLWKLMEPHILPEMRDHLKPKDMRAGARLFQDSEYEDDDDDEEDVNDNDDVASAQPGSRAQNRGEDGSDEGAFVSVGTRERTNGMENFGGVEMLGESKEREKGGTREGERWEDSDEEDLDKQRTAGKGDEPSGASRDWEGEDLQGLDSADASDSEGSTGAGRTGPDGWKRVGIESGSGSESDSDDDEADWMGLADAVEAEKVRPVRKKPIHTFSRR